MTRRPARLRVLLPALLIVLAGCGGGGAEVDAAAAPVCATPVAGAAPEPGATAGLVRPVDARDERELSAVTPDQADLVQRLHDAEEGSGHGSAEHASVEHDETVEAHAAAAPVPLSTSPAGQGSDVEHAAEPAAGHGSGVEHAAEPAAGHGEHPTAGDSAAGAPAGDGHAAEVPAAPCTPADHAPADEAAHAEPAEPASGGH